MGLGCARNQRYSTDDRASELKSHRILLPAVLGSGAIVAPARAFVIT
jgi:hypothetical protein